MFIILPELIFSSVDFGMIFEAAFRFKHFATFVAGKFCTSFFMDKLHVTFQAVLALDQLSADLAGHSRIRPTLSVGIS